VNPKIAGKWMFIPLKMVLIGIDPYPCQCPFQVFSKSSNLVKWLFDLLFSSEETSCSAGFAAGVCKASLWWATGRLDLDYRSPGGHGSTVSATTWVKNVKRQQK